MQSELPVIVALVVVLVGIPFAMFLVKILRGDFWPLRLYDEYRHGKRDGPTPDET
ncbi:hypothetical protein JMJ58_01570 [Haloterrigena salifodinae]|uniref:Uncharacterized protein n=1 Tax=Haloterrigena salifodinae TaxID=2675099 RepID=A0A8T8E2L5_9EURY|nr:hypothetical protein [Haloterrigena salifodinae]QRV15621.1 hypothetical protein JMJ58_01570 [Haloterrigena salifodinae]